jgi:hypothetical protein
MDYIDPKFTFDNLGEAIGQLIRLIYMNIKQFLAQKNLIVIAYTG